MHAFVRGLVRAAAESFTLPGPLLAVGALSPPVRACFPGRDFTTLPAPERVGTLLVLHAEPLPDLAVLRPDGVLLLTAAESLPSIPAFAHVLRGRCGTWLLAFGPEGVRPSTAALTLFRERLRTYARPPQPLLTWLRSFLAPAHPPHLADFTYHEGDDGQQADAAARRRAA